MITSSKILTNHLLFDELDLWNQLDGKSVSDDDTRKYYQMIDDLIDSQIGESISWLESDEAKDIFSRKLKFKKKSSMHLKILGKIFLINLMRMLMIY